MRPPSQASRTSLRSTKIAFRVRQSLISEIVAAITLQWAVIPPMPAAAFLSLNCLLRYRTILADLCASLDNDRGRAMSETRKIAAILAADVVGFGRLASSDEDRTLARRRTLPKTPPVLSEMLSRSARRPPRLSRSCN